jgi:hypothetical protein
MRSELLSFHASTDPYVVAGADVTGVDVTGLDVIGRYVIGVDVTGGDALRGVFSGFIENRCHRNGQGIKNQKDS